MLFSCHPKVNQYQKISNTLRVKTGKWVIEDHYPNENYKSAGRYKVNEKVGVWRTYLNGKIYQKDRYKGNVICTKIFHPNGKLAQKGQSKTNTNKDSVVWFYFGKWSYYDDNGKLDHIKIFYKNKKSDSINCRDNKTKCLIIR